MNIDGGQKWNSRKLLVAIAIEAWTSYLLITGKVPASVWETVTMATVVAYIGSQAWVDRKVV